MLSTDEIRRATRTLRRRFHNHPDVISVGFGAALRDGVVDSERPFVVCLWVKRKRARSRVKSVHRLPTSVLIRLKRAGAFKTLEIPVDVEEVAGIVPTAASIEPGKVTTSAVLRWTLEGEDRTHFGFVTVGHGFMSASDVVTVTRRNREITGRIIWQSSDRDYIDGAIVECDRSAIERLGATLDEQTDRPIPLPLAEVRIVTTKTQEHGVTMSCRSARQLTYQSYQEGPIDIDLARKLPPLRHVIGAIGAAPHVFEPGTSGSLWLCDSGPVAIQVAARAPDYQVGYAVALDPSLARMYVRLRAETMDLVALI